MTRGCRDDEREAGWFAEMTGVVTSEYYWYIVWGMDGWLSARSLASFLKYKISKKKIPLLLLFLGLFLYYRERNSFSALVKQQRVPRIPPAVWEAMQSQVPNQGWACGDRAFKWFSFYDSESGQKVKTKLSGYCTTHFHSLVNQSLRFRFGDTSLKLKSFGSEVLPGDLLHPFPLIFSEFTVYRLAGRYFPHTPKAKIVYLNDDPSDIHILWNDLFPNKVREKTNVNWKELEKSALYAPAERFSRYFDQFWKISGSTYKKAKDDFSQTVLLPFLQATTRSPSALPANNLDVDDYLTYLAIANIFGSNHISDHNLVFTQSKKGKRWHPVIYDFGGFYSPTKPLVTTLPLNKISEALLRNPQYAYQYLKQLHYLNQEILGKRRISALARRFSCQAVKRYPSFGEMLLKTTHTGVVPRDINGYCASWKRLSQYDKAGFEKLDQQLNLSSFRWNYYRDGDDRPPLLAMWSPEIIPAKVEKIYCGRRDCSGDFVLTNPPWWQGEDRLLLSRIVREPVGASGGGSFRTTVTPYYYLFRWQGKGDPPSPDKLSFLAKNAVTGVSLLAVRDFYPIMLFSEEKLAQEGQFQLTGRLLNPSEGEFQVKDYNPERDDQWNVRVVPKNCQLKGGKFPRFTLDCSQINFAHWPYPLGYVVALHYQASQIRTVFGEVYQDVALPEAPNAVTLTADNLAQFKLPSAQALVKTPAFQQLLATLPERDQRRQLAELAERGKEAYLFPENAVLQVDQDLDLGEAILFFRQGARIEVSPLAKITAGALFVAGSADRPVTFASRESLSHWFGIQLSWGGYLNHAKILKTANARGALFGQGLDPLIVRYSSFERNLENIRCDNCQLAVFKSDFRWGKWAVRAKDSLLMIKDTNCKETEYCFKALDTLATIDGTHATNILAGAFVAEGMATEMSVTNSQLETVPVAFIKKFFPKITTDLDLAGKISGSKVAVWDFDSLAMHNNPQEQSLDEFARRNRRFLLRDRRDPRKFFFRQSKRPLVLTKDLLIPAGATVEFLPGTNVLLAEGVSIASFGKIVARGTEEAPIVFSSADPEGRPWGVFLLRGDQAEGVFEHCSFENGGGDFLVGFDYTGMLTAHYAKKLTVTNSVFRGSKGDDGLNCKNSWCEIDSNLFEETSFDGVDLDAPLFSVVRGNLFRKIGNDAIDLSGGDPQIYENTVKVAGDKCVSVGENSHPLIFNNSFEKCRIGIETKDNSRVIAIGNSFRDNELALNGYQKKKRFFRGGQAKVYNSDFSGNGELVEVDAWSSIKVFDEFDAGIEEKYLPNYVPSPRPTQE